MIAQKAGWRDRRVKLGIQVRPDAGFRSTPITRVEPDAFAFFPLSGRY